MNMMRRALMAAAAALAFVGPNVMAADANVAGEWTMTVESSQGSGSPIFNLKQQGTAVTGTYKGRLGETPVTGTVAGNQVTLSYKINTLGFNLEVIYSGTVDGNTMAGKVTMGALGEGTFTGKKK